MHLYVHVPFCKQACHYCDFYFSTSLQQKNRLLEALKREIFLRKNYLPSQELETIYFGGGTPSLLEQNELEDLLNEISKYFTISSTAEISLEANPDDLKIQKLQELKSAGINRLSIGVQSFNEQNLKFLHRVHSSEQAHLALRNSIKVGFENSSVDLIYSIQNSSHAIFENDLEQLFSYQINHLSAYSLTIEPNTVFGKWEKNKKIKSIDTEFSAEQYMILQEKCEKNGFEKYEVSNFCREKKYSKHNTAYWFQKPYLGIGPSAHSYDSKTRQFSVSNTIKYCQGIEKKIPYFEMEILSTKDKINEYLLTRLRTKWGCNIQELNALFEGDFIKGRIKIVEKLRKLGWLEMTKEKIFLTKEGYYFADKVTLELFFE